MAALSRRLGIVSVYILRSTTMTDRQIIVPDGKQLLYDHSGLGFDTFMCDGDQI